MPLPNATIEIKEPPVLSVVAERTGGLLFKGDTSPAQTGGGASRLRCKNSSSLCSRQGATSRRRVGRAGWLLPEGVAAMMGCCSRARQRRNLQGDGLQAFSAENFAANAAPGDKRPVAVTPSGKKKGHCQENQAGCERKSPHRRTFPHTSRRPS